MRRVLESFSIVTLIAAGYFFYPDLACAASDAPAASAKAAAAAAAAPTPVKGGVVTLSPANTKIVFVGTHAAPKKPDPRTGNFEKFSGKAEVDAEKKTLKSVAVEIETASLKTEIDKLTNHLNSPDFFDTREYPKAKFESTKITAGKDGEHTITGKLTLLKTTKEISFPAKVAISDKGLSLHSSFKIDRLDYGVGVNQSGVERPVSLTITIGGGKDK